MRMKFGLAVALSTVLAAPVALADLPKFKHVVIIVQENRTPDNIFGSNPNFEPGVDIATGGYNSQGKYLPLQPYPINTCFDVGHTHASFVNAYRNGGMNGFDLVGGSLTTGSCPRPPNAAYAYADNSTGTVQPYFDLATQYGFANRMFQTNQGPSFPAHLFLFTGTSAPDTYSTLFAAENPSPADHGSGCIAPATTTVALIDPSGSETAQTPTYPCYELPTFSDQLDAAKLSWRYYTPTASQLWDAPGAIRHICGPTPPTSKSGTCTGAEFKNHVALPPKTINDDIANCKLANVSWVIPNGQTSDHPRASNASGPSWVASIVNAIGTRDTCPDGDTYWRSTAILVTWDDWGGFYDHVPPFRLGQSNGWGAGYTYGFRVPLLVISAYTPPGTVVNDILDFGSLLRFTEDNFGLSRIGPGFYADAYANGLNSFFAEMPPRSFTRLGLNRSVRVLEADSRATTAPDDY